MWIGGTCLASLFGLAFFPFVAPLLPTFGSIEIQGPAKEQRWSGREITCRRNLGMPIISYLDPDTGSERTFTLTPGDAPLDASVRANARIYPLGNVLIGQIAEPLDKKACRVFGGFIRNELGGSQGGLFEYRLSLDCDHANARIRADLHGYNCLSD